MTAIIETEKLTKSYGEPPRDHRRRPRGRRGRGLRLPRTERRRQDDDDPDRAGPDPPDQRPGAGLRHRVERRSGRDPPARRLHPGRVHAVRPADRRPDDRSTSPTCAAASTPPTRPRSSSASTSTRRASSRSTRRATSRRSASIIALQHRPELLILDEPTSGLDPLVQQSFYALVREAERRGPDGLPVEPHPVRGRADLRSRRDHPGRPAGQGGQRRGPARSRPSPGGAAVRDGVPVAAFEGLPGVSPRSASRTTSCGCACRGRSRRSSEAAAQYELLDFVSREPTPRGDVPRRSTARRPARRHGHEHQRRTVPSPSARTTTSPWSRIYGLGSVYAKTLRDSRLAFLIVAGLLGGPAAVERRRLRRGVCDSSSRAPTWRPSSRACRRPWPASTATRSRRWSRRSAARSPGRPAASLGLIAASGRSWPCRPRWPAEARRGSLELVAVTPLGLRRIALEKLAAHLTVMLIVVVVVAVTTWLAGAAFGTLPGDEIPPVMRDRVRAVGRASSRSRRVPSPWPWRRSSGVAPRPGSPAPSSSAATSSTAIRRRVPAFAGLANLTWFGWTVDHQPLVGQPDWLSLGLVAIVAIVLFAIGVEAFSRRDLGSTSRIPWPGFPEATLGLGGPTSRSFGERLPLALAWGIGIGLFAFVIAAAARSSASRWPTSRPRRSRSSDDLPEHRPDIRRGRASCSSSSSSSGSSWPASRRRPSSPAGHRTRPAAGWRSCWRRRCRAARWAVSGGFGVYAAIVAVHRPARGRHRGSASPSAAATS